MEATVQIEDRFARVTLSGPIAIDKWKEAYHQLLSHPDFRKDMDTLWDFRAVEEIHTLQPSDMHAIAREVTDRAEKRGAGRVALVMAREVDFGLARMYELMSDGLVPLSIRVFRDLGEAEAWLTETD
jgi:hypothetical protein